MTGPDRPERLEERVAREREAHTERDVLAANRRWKRLFSHIETYPSRRRLYAGIARHVADLRDRHVLDLGCGEGERSLTYLARGGRVCGIDLSPVYVRRATEAAERAGHPRERFRFEVRDAHDLTAFEPDTFDLVVAYGVLHHLDYPRALRELWRVLRPGGRALFQEPLADNPLLRLFRLLTPAARTPDERPLGAGDLRAIAELPGWSCELSYCGLLEAPLALVTSLLLRPWHDNLPLRLADRLERRLQARSLLPTWNQYVAINLLKRGHSAFTSNS